MEAASPGGFLMGDVKVIRPSKFPNGLACQFLTSRFPTNAKFFFSFPFFFGLY